MKKIIYFLDNLYVVKIRNKNNLYTNLICEIYSKSKRTSFYKALSEFNSDFISSLTFNFEELPTLLNRNYNNEDFECIGYGLICFDSEDEDEAKLVAFRDYTE